MQHKGHLEVVNPDTGEIGDKRVWMVNNQIVFTDDGFKTTKTVLGEFTVDGTTYYGLLAQAVIAGLIKGSTIEGGTINIGEYTGSDGKKHYAFSVDEQGVVKMNGNSGEKYFTFDPSEGLILGDDGKFYAVLTGTDITFKDNKNKTLVTLGNNKSQIANLTATGQSTFDDPTTFNSQVSFENFVWKVEENGSLSLSLG